MKNKKTHRILALTLSALTLGASVMASACKDEAKTEVDATVWTASSSVKIKQEEDYSSMYGNKELSFTVFRNENESAQILFNPKSDVAAFDLTVSDLTDANGNLLSKDSFSVFAQKYIEVKSISDPKTPTGAGMYPDALVPMENYVDSKENACTSGDNQGLWIKIKPSKTQAAGVYTGTFQLKLDDSTYDVPVKVEVLEYTLSDAKHTKQDFGLAWQRLEGTELDSTVEMQEAYYEFMLDYRVDSGGLPGMETNYDPNSEGIEERLDNWVERLAEATLDERVGFTRIPYVNSSAVDEYGNTVTCVNISQLRKVLTKMMEYSVEHNINLFSKAGTYFQSLDERTLKGDVDDCNYTYKTTRELYQTMAEEYRAEWEQNGELSEFQETVLLSLKNIRDLCVGMYVDTMTSPCTYVPLLTYMSSDSLIATYQNWLDTHYDEGYRDLWTYTCENPKIPYPTYHIEDTALSARMFSWMMYEYNIVGNLLWQYALGGPRGGEYGAVQGGYFQDQYNTARKFARVNGDGFLVYPGREYGVYGPVASVRLEGVLDGNEDFEFLYALEQNYIARAAAKNVAYNDEHFDNVLAQLTKELYTGISYNYTEDYIEIFENSRKILNNLLLMSENCGVVVENITSEKGVVSVTVSAPEATKISVDGVLKEGTNENGIVTYRFQIPLVNDENALRLTAKTEAYEYTVALDFGAKLQVVSLAGEFEGGKVAVTLDGGEANVKTSTQRGKGLELLYNVVGGEELSGHTAVLDLSALNIDKTQAYITLNIVAQEDMKITVAGKAKNGVYISAGTVELKAGENEVKIELSEFNLTKNGNLQLLRLRLADDTVADRSYTLTLYDMLVGG